MSWAHTHTERVRFGDLDAMKHLNNVVFLRYFETARINYLNALMDSHDPVNRADGFGFIFASCTIDYRSPAHFDEDVAIRVRPAEIGTKSLKLEFEMAVGRAERAPPLACGAHARILLRLHRHRLGTRRIRRRDPRRPARDEDRRDREGHGRRPLPELRLHPGEGGPAHGRHPHRDRGGGRLRHLRRRCQR
jgi:YbgC/YbaW family acyl-CoA thioester hydrolase